MERKFGIEQARLQIRCLVAGQRKYGPEWGYHSTDWHIQNLIHNDSVFDKLDSIHYRWTVFTMYWPAIMCAALVGKE